jgi:hypothetical protein
MSREARQLCIKAFPSEVLERLQGAQNNVKVRKIKAKAYLPSTSAQVFRKHFDSKML